MEKLESLDLDSTIGGVTLSNGQRLDIPKLSMMKIIKVVKFLGIDGSKLYSECREILLDKDLEDLEKLAVVLEALDERQLVQIFGILLEMEADQVLKLDQNEMLEITLVYVDKLDLKKTYSLVRQLMKKLFNKDLPENPGEWFVQMQQNRMKQKMMQQQAAMEMASQSSSM